MSDLTLSVVIETLLGPLELEDPPNGYELHTDTFNSRSVSHRKTEVIGDWTEGGDVDRSLRDNITESLAVWVGGATTFEFQTRLKVLTDAFEQLSYPVTRTVGDLREVWSCRPSDYTIETSQPYLVAKVGLVKVQLVRKPAVTMSQVTGP